MPAPNPPRRRRYVREYPATAEDDVLVQAHENLPDRLRALATEIVAGTASGRHASAYCISGPWGAGKSSALMILKDIIKDVAGNELRIEFATFRAPLHAAQRTSVRLGLLADIVFSMEPSVQLKVADSLGFQAHQASLATSPQAAQRVIQPRAFIYSELSQLSSSPISLENFMARELSECLRGSEVSPTAPSGYVVFIEDLDRTDLEYTKELLRGLTFWREEANIFFVVACSKDHLTEASRLLPQTSDTKPDGDPLPKHIHFTLELPQLIPSDSRCAEFARELLEGVEMVGQGERLTELLNDHHLGHRLLSPLLSRRNPREVIETLNRILGEFYSFPDPSADQPGRSLDDQQVKQLVAQAVWPNEFAAHVFPILSLRPNDATGDSKESGLQDQAAEIHYRTSIEIARSALRTGDADVRLGILAEGARVDLSIWPKDLLLYLASDPPLLPPEEEVHINRSATRWTERSPYSAEETREPSPVDQQASTLVDQDDSAKIASLDISNINPTSAASIDIRLREIVLHLDAASSQPPGEERHRDEVHQLTELDSILRDDSESLDSSHAPLIGNLALRTARIDIDYALQLHLFAHQLDEEHVNVRLNLADFILDNQPGAEDASKFAFELAEWCVNNRPDELSGKAQHLYFRAKARLGSVDAHDRKLATDLFDFALSEDTNAYWIELFESFSSVGWLDEIEKLAKQLVADRPNQTFEVLRGFGDTLATSQWHSRHQRVAADLFRWLCCESGILFDSELHTYSDRSTDEILADTAHNLAILLYAFDYDDAAAAMWRWVYSVTPDGLVRRAYSSLVADYLGDAESALRVLNGQEIALPEWSYEDARQAVSEAPYRFDDESGSHWWEEIPVAAEAEQRQREHFLSAFGTAGR